MSNKTTNQLEGRLEDYRHLLSVLAATYDAGHEIVALSMSAAIRTLVHDTANSTSLLKHLGLKTTLDFVSTNSYTKDTVHLGLVRKIMVGVHDGVGGEAKYWPLCDETHFSPNFSARPLGFEDWWRTERVFVSPSASLTRRDLVLAVANKDGGAHFDIEVEKKYDEFRHSWSSRKKYVGIRSGVVRGWDNIPINPAIRQIVFELMQTIA